MSTPQTELQMVRDYYIHQPEPVHDELALARDIQLGLLPHQLPISANLEVHALTVPSFDVGGDYYDTMPLPGGRFGFAVADVSGKGLPAAILSASLQGAFAAIATDDLDLPGIFSRVNDFLYARSSEEMYATMFYGVLDPGGDFTFVNAGHTQPLVIRANQRVKRLRLSNLPLGLFPRTIFRAAKVHLQPGDLVLLFSDGLTEAQDFTGGLFGDGRLNKVAKRCARLSAVAATKEILQAVRTFVGPAPLSDDLTLLVLRYRTT